MLNIIACLWLFKQKGVLLDPFLINISNHKQSSMRNYYTYAYLREDGSPYYIGKGTRRRIHSKLHRVNLPPEERRIFLKQNLTAEEASNHEIYLIFIFGRKDIGTGILRNMTDGGEGPSGKIVSEKTRKKISNSLTGRKLTIEHIDNIKKTHPGITPHHRKKMLEGLKNHNQNGEKNPNWGKRWWNNGIHSLMSVECPGKEYALGRLYKRRINKL